MQVRQPLHGAPDEAAPEVAECVEHPADGARLEPDVVVEVEHRGGGGVVEEVLPVLRQATPFRVGEERDGPALCLQDAQHGGHRRLGGGVLTRGLVAEDEAQVDVGLRRQPGERGREFGGPPDGRDQDVDLGRIAVVRQGARPGAGPAGGGHGAGSGSTAGAGESAASVGGAVPARGSRSGGGLADASYDGGRRVFGNVVDHHDLAAVRPHDARLLEHLGGVVAALDVDLGTQALDERDRGVGREDGHQVDAGERGEDTGRGPRRC